MTVTHSPDELDQPDQQNTGSATQPNSLEACNPANNATVSASAGSGKTWLLITRIVRLLLSGAEPGNIIALTFTRKAANEMQVRLNERLFELATADNEALEDALKLIGSDVTASNKTAARNLYEKLMRSLHPIRIQTFHSFCQDILSRFPLEADIPPGFELIEDSSLLEKQAWQTLFTDAADSEQATLTENLDYLMQVCNGPGNTQTALHNFLAHRSDWWAYTAHITDGIRHAQQQLALSLKLDATLTEQKTIDPQQPARVFLNDTLRLDLAVFANLLRLNKTKTADKQANNIDAALAEDCDANQSFSLIVSAFLTRAGEKLSQGRKHTAALEKKLGSDDAERFIDLHNEIADKIIATTEQCKRLLTYKVNQAWYVTGQHYISIFQQLKRQQRLLDFTDLEWKCYQLLQHADNAHWVQYKIDQRINHLLIDEFQDTNPTQWHLLSPILEEIAASPEQRDRSVFLVGDEKQSIYSFRRANPELQTQASDWLAQHLNAKATPLDFSRRSSGAIMQCVNHVFSQEDIKRRMPGFSTHDTHLDTVPGRVAVCDLFTEEKGEAENNAETEPVSFRNSLLQPRAEQPGSLRHKEAAFIAAQIELITQAGNYLTDGSSTRQINYGDIMILTRNRTHVAIYEQALKKAGIPFIGSKKGGLFDNLEMQDLICLLNTLITPFDNLALAQVLKSPLFNASDDDLILLAKVAEGKPWYETLQRLADEDSTKISDKLERAARLLNIWHGYADVLPVHDCLDKIYSEGNLIERYTAANRAENKSKVAANCQQLLEMSLDTEAGRYPSITRFLQRLQHLQFHADNPPEEPLTTNTSSRVSLLTIHASKGLEAPVIFLADCNQTSANKNAYDCLVRWPAEAKHPVSFQLQLSKEKTDQITERQQAEKLEEQKREELNLLYVALTRAREQLYISGIDVRAGGGTGKSNASKSNSGKTTWYQQIRDGLLEASTDTELALAHPGIIIEHLAYDTSAVATEAPATPPDQNTVHTPIDERLLKPVAVTNRAPFLLAPSHEESSNSAASDRSLSKWDTAQQHQETQLAQWKGITIHRFLELLCQSKTYPATEAESLSIKQQIEKEVLLQQPEFKAYVTECLTQAMQCYNAEHLAEIFNSSTSQQSYNEMPLLFEQNGQAIFGYVDRVIRDRDMITVIDYKSHQFGDTESPQNLAQHFARQLDYYKQGISLLWPNIPVRKGILFTEKQKIIWLQ